MTSEPDRAMDAGAGRPGEPAVTSRRKAWLGLISAFCMALGMFLVIVPWVDMWQQSYVSFLGPQWRGIWLNTYFRGAASGLGVVDIYIGIHELFGSRVPPTAC